MDKPPTQEITADIPALKEESVRGGDYAILGLLTFINVLNFIDRQLLASFANFIVPDLGLTNTQFGLLTGFAFIVFYAVMGLFMGVLADRLHRPRLLAFGLALWSALTAFSGLAKGFVTMLIPRMLIGIGESVATPTAISMLADRFPAHRMGFAASIYYMGVPIGVAISLLVAGYLGPAIGWRNCFYLLGALGIIVALIVLFIPETPRKGIAPNQAQTGNNLKVRDSVRLLVRSLKTSPALVCTILGGVAFHFVLGAAAFEQLWFVQERGFERAAIAIHSGWLAAGGGLLGTLLGGILSDIWQQKFKSGRPMFLFWTSLILTPFVVAYRVVAPDSFFFDLGIVLGFMQLGLFYGPTFSTVQELVPAHIRATVVAFYILTLNLIGLGIGITAGGITIDYLIAQGVAEPYTQTLLAFTLLSATSIPLMYVAGKRFHQDKAALANMTDDL
ncbi:MAG: MFS transporter [Alphaproteobacteria bacterium]|nr:MFS transporter [Alphaproteobacteria bacterium]MBE8219907.1 MFS transporter [Alphaproteobacteria bacterium]